MKKRFTNLDTVHPHLSEQQSRCGKWPWLGMMGRGRVRKNILEVEMRVVAMAGQGGEGGLDRGRAEAGHNSQLPLIACHICLSLGVKTPWHSE